MLFMMTKVSPIFFSHALSESEEPGQRSQTKLKLITFIGGGADGNFHQFTIKLRSSWRVFKPRREQNWFVMYSLCYVTFFFLELTKMTQSSKQAFEFSRALYQAVQSGGGESVSSHNGKTLYFNN